MSDATTTTTTTVGTVSGTWVARGPAGAVGSIHRTDEGFAIRQTRDDTYHGEYPTLDVAKRALHASLGPGADRPEFVEH